MKPAAVVSVRQKRDTAVEPSSAHLCFSRKKGGNKVIIDLYRGAELKVEIRAAACSAAQTGPNGALLLNYIKHFQSHMAWKHGTF